MSRPAKREWHTDPLRDTLTLSISVEVNGRQLVAAMTMPEHHRFSTSAPMPFRQVERELRRQLMREVERELLGPEGA